MSKKRHYRQKSVVFFTIVLTIFLTFTLNGKSFAKIEWAHLKDISLEETPKDIALSNDNSIAYILCDKNILVFSFDDNKITDKIPVKGNFSSITISKNDDSLLLTDATSKQISIIEIEMIYNFDVGDSPIIGKADAPVSIVAFLDFQCPYCARAFPILEQMLEKYPNDVRVIIKHYPLRQHKFARSASVAALAASKQGKYKEVVEKLFENFRNLNEDTVKQYFEELNIDMEKIETEKKDPALNRIIGQDIKDGSGAGVRGVPALFVNGKRVQNRSIEGFSEMIESALKKMKVSEK